MSVVSCQYPLHACRRPAFILDTRQDRVLCPQHRIWVCEGCGGEHGHREFLRYSDAEGYSLTCPDTHKIVLLGSWGPVAALPLGTSLGDICRECWGKGRCQCVGAEIGPHERCLRCCGGGRCTFCHGAGVRSF